MPSSSKVVFRPLTFALLALGGLFVLAGVIYVTKSAAHLPAFFPGRQHGATRHHTKHGIAMFGLAALSWIGAWFTTAPGR